MVTVSVFSGEHSAPCSFIQGNRLPVGWKQIPQRHQWQWELQGKASEGKGDTPSSRTAGTRILYMCVFGNHAEYVTMLCSMSGFEHGALYLTFKKETGLPSVQKIAKSY